MTTAAPAPLDRSRPPAAGAARAFRFPAFERGKLAGGLELYLAPDSRTPLVHMQWLSPGGAHFDPAGRPGLAALTSALLDEGTTRRSSTEIADAVERLGGFLGGGADWDGVSLAVSLLNRHLEFGLELLAEIVVSPSFPEAELERQRHQTLAELRRRRALPASLASDRLRRALYGTGPYGSAVLGEVESVGGFSRDDVEGFYRRRLLTRGAALVAVGDFDPGALTALAGGALGDSLAKPAAPAAVSPIELAANTVYLVDRPQAAQTELRLGHAGISRTHPDRIEAMVMNSLLGGKFMSRINLNLRERHGYTYGAQSRFAGRRAPGPFVVSAAVANDVAGAATREVLSEMRRIRLEPVEIAELEDTRNYLLGSFPATLQSQEGVAARLADLAIHSLPDDYWGEFPRRLAAVDREDVLRVARELLQPERLAIVAVGPAEILRTQFEELGPVVE